MKVFPRRMAVFAAVALLSALAISVSAGPSVTMSPAVVKVGDTIAVTIESDGWNLKSGPTLEGPATGTLTSTGGTLTATGPGYVAISTSWERPDGNGGEETASASGTATVVDVEIRRVMVQSPENAVVFFLLRPSGISGRALFQGQVKDVEGLFWMNFDQTSIQSEKIMYLRVLVESIRLTRSLIGKRMPYTVSSAGSVTVYFPSEGIGLRVYRKTISESWGHIYYSAPVTSESKTMHLERSSSAVNTLKEPVSYSESHKYSPIQDAFIPMAWSGAGSFTGYELISDIWLKPQTIQATSRTISMSYYDPLSGLSRIHGIIAKSDVSLNIK